MSLSLESAQTTAYGPFNPHIITPEWLVANGICPDGELEWRLQPLAQGVAFSLEDVQWQVDFRRLAVKSRRKDCGAFVANVIALLEHTPVRSICNNFNYACDLEGWGASPMPMGDLTHVPGLVPGELAEQLRWSCSLRIEDAKTDITVARRDPGIVVFTSFYRTTDSPDQRLRAAHRFAADRDKSQQLLRRMFNQEVVT